MLSSISLSCQRSKVKKMSFRIGSQFLFECPFKNQVMKENRDHSEGNDQIELQCKKLKTQQGNKDRKQASYEII